MMQTHTCLIGFLLCGVIVTLSFLNADAAPTISSSSEARAYLQQFNHMPRDNMQTGVFLTEEDYVEALISFQRMANLTVTGELDEDTIVAMNLPRCGMPDNMGFSNTNRRKRYSAMNKWPKNDLTWRIASYTAVGTAQDLPEADIDSIMQAALEAWSDVSQLTFTKSTADDADIIIDFFNDDHGDGNPFDGPSGVLAHAYFPLPAAQPAPIAGDAHFDDEETYTQNGDPGIDLFQVAAHEFGHSLGLGHSEVDGALMGPFYRGYVANFQLHEDDVAGIQVLYGINSGVPEQTMKPFVPSGGEECPSQLDTIVRVADGRTFAFAGNLVYDRLDDGIAPGYPQPISQVFEGLPNDIDAGFFYPGLDRTFFFKGDQYWRFSNTIPDAGYPRDISEFAGVPADIDAAFVWSGNGQLYFVKGDQYYRFNARRGFVDRGYPRSLSIWNLPVDTIDAAQQWANGITYFYAGDRYYRFNDAQSRVEDGYEDGLSTSFWWFGCGDQELTGGNSNGGLAKSVPSMIVSLLSLGSALLCLII